MELDIPGSILENANPTHTFPLPPSVLEQSAELEPSEGERGWYYYLSEIAARHLLNRVLRAHSWSKEQPAMREIRNMIAQAEIFENQLHEWHSRLPAMFYFETPSGPAIDLASDDLVQILRSRYLTCRELIYRPFVRLCVENRLDIDPDTRRLVASLASQSLQYCVYKLSQVSPHLHHGTWFALRNAATSSLILIAASKACSDLNLLGAHELVLPEGWRERISRTLDIVNPFWSINEGGSLEIRQIIESSLANSASDLTSSMA